MNPTLLNQLILAAATLLASLGGYTLAGLNERRRDARTLRRELQMRHADQYARRVEETHSFQRETLLALQDAVQLMARRTGKAMHFDHMQAREGKYTQLPGSLSEEMHSNGVEVRRHASRVLDSGIRGAVDEFVRASVALSMSPKPLEGLRGEALEQRVIAQSMQLNESYDAVTSALGEALRREIAWEPEGRA